MAERKKREKYFFPALCILAVFLYGASVSHNPISGKYKGYNVILIIADSLRPDALGCYNPQKRNTPAIDRLAKKSRVFTNAFCPIPLTISSVVSLFTGTYPPAHNVLHVFKDTISPSLYTMAEIFQSAGYTTAWYGHLRDPHTGKIDGFFQGFSQWGDILQITPGHGLGFLREDYREPLQWIQCQKKTPFFLVIHSYLPHESFNMRRLLAVYGPETFSFLTPEWKNEAIEAIAAENRSWIEYPEGEEDGTWTEEKMKTAIQRIGTRKKRERVLFSVRESFLRKIRNALVFAGEQDKKSCLFKWKRASVSLTNNWSVSC